MIVLKIVSLAVWLLAIPFALGLLPGFLIPEEERTPGRIFLLGYMLWFALFELVGIPVVIAVVYHGFSLLCGIFGALSLFMAVAAVIVTERACGKRYNWKGWSFAGFKRISMEEKAAYLLFAVILGFQMYMAFTRASFDGDDAYYGVQGLIARQQDTLYRINPGTGRSSPLDVRHAMALLPVWEAFIGKVSGIHTTIIAHSAAPLILLPLSYLVYFQIGQKLFAGKKEALPFFMVVMALFQMFGNVSIYTNETFLLTRTWQGKSLAGNFMIPMVFWLFLCLFEEREDLWEAKAKKNGYFILLAILNLAVGISSSQAVLLNCMLTAGLAVLFAVRERRFSVLVKGGLACIPGAAYILTYLIISH